MDKDKFHDLVEKYFDADTSAEEERMLLREALRMEGKDPMADEVIAVMGYSKCSRKLRHVPNVSPLVRRYATVAAIVAAIAIAGLTVMTRNESNLSECYAYVDGIKIENQTEIASLIGIQLEEVSEAGETVEDAISDDLDEMREAMKL